MAEQKFTKKIENNAMFDSISWENILSILHGTGNVKVTGYQIGYYDQGTWPAFFVNHGDGTGHLESLGGHIWSEFATKRDYNFSAREGITMGVFGQDYRLFGDKKI